MGASQSSPSAPPAARSSSSAPATLSEKQVTALESSMARVHVTEDGKQHGKRPATAELTMDDVQAWHASYEAEPSKAVIGTLLRCVIALHLLYRHLQR